MISVVPGGDDQEDAEEAERDPRAECQRAAGVEPPEVPVDNAWE